MALEQTIKENFWLAQDYQIFQNCYLNDKDNLMDLYDNKVKVEAAVRDHQEVQYYCSISVLFLTCFLKLNYL